MLRKQHDDSETSVPNKRSLIWYPGEDAIASRLRQYEPQVQVALPPYVAKQHKDSSAGGTKETKVYFGTRERNRTSDQKFRKLLLYPLSYPGGKTFYYNTGK